MARIIIASASASSREQVSRLLASSGYDVFRLCASGGELRRALTECEDGVVLMKILDAIYKSAETGHEVRIK